jgi:hypothetical protein
MDHNKHTYNRPLGCAFAGPARLGMNEAVLRHTGTCTGATLFRGSKSIDGLWTTSNIVIPNVCMMPFGYGIGDHRMFVLNVTLESFIGSTPTKVVRPAARQLNRKIPQCSKAYIKDLEEKIIQHC